MSSKFLYEEMTWPEIREAAKAGRVALVPVGMIEDHGHHLPVDTDALIVGTIARRAAALIPEMVVCLPEIKFGYSPHHMDFPGTITIGAHTFIDYLLDVCRSLIHHGFKRVLLVNGHGSNAPFVDIASRLAIIEHPDTLCATVSWWSIDQVRQCVAEFRESQFPGGMSHACEAETSLYLAIRPELVYMERAAKEIGFPPSKYFWYDLMGGTASGYSSVLMAPHWSTVTQTGVMGDPTKATKEKGERILKAASEGLVDVIRELGKREIRARIDHHT